LAFQKGIQAQNSGATIRCKNGLAGCAEGLKYHDLFTTVFIKVKIIGCRSTFLSPLMAPCFANQLVIFIDLLSH